MIPELDAQRPSSKRGQPRWGCVWRIAFCCLSTQALAAEAPFALRVVDQATGRGVPLVELRTTGELRFYTDSAGYAAIDAPELMDREVFFHVSSHGYEFPQDGFGFRGRRLRVAPGGEATLPIQRVNIAERLYRVTGAGIYADSVRLGREVPIPQPLLAGGVVGQDSVQAAVLGERILWFWGDTNRLSYPLGQFRTSAAGSRLPSAGGLDPAVGVDLEYLVDPTGFSRPVFDLEGPGVVWLDGLAVVHDAAGRPRVVGHYSRREGLARQLAHGLAEFDPQRGMFEVRVELPEGEWRHVQGQVSRAPEGGDGYLYIATPYASLRVPARYESLLDPEQYEAFTPLAPGMMLSDGPPPLERDAGGQVVYAWKRGARPLSANEEYHLIRQGQLPREAAHWQTVEAASGERVLLHGGSVRWNAFRNKWVLIAVQTFGQPSFLGEVWYAEADRPEGPWRKCVRIITHDKYSFYNPTHHDFFDQEGGRLIYLEGTYTHTFSGNPHPTPRYDYNQIMYRLDLSDERLAPARGE